jgi:hypothetical protein
VRGGGALGHAGRRGAGTAVVLSLAIEGGGARGPRPTGAGSLLQNPAQHGDASAGEQHLPKEESPRRGWAVRAAARSSLH